MLSNCSFIIGNSSSGITDAHLLKVKSINVGNRQDGRVSPRSVINVKSNMNSIMKGIKKVLKRTNFKFHKPSSLNKNGSKLILRKIKEYLNNEKNKIL